MQQAAPPSCRARFSLAAAQTIMDGVRMTDHGPERERTVRELMSVLSLCDQVDLWRYGRSAGLAVLLMAR
jgi:hypothetical protein